ncbi:kynureninase [Paracoccus marinaquae]|uniref:Kynureninase n=1 Tax=Paracoccus marinaquae TaxID=2841926 RepID=A0ABS6AG84_9RHOB|nr:kynureninase [Paracoccus marinaquae]MBU3029524.1 kynureninase [Paracoccus marinaquae]
MLTRDDCARLDAQDELSALRDEFALPDGVIYLDGNSLGALPKGAVATLSKAVEQEWGQGLIRSWGEAEWFSLPERLGDRLGRLIGAAPGQVVVCDGTSINIYKALRAAMEMRPDRKVLVSELGSFPTDLYMLEGALIGADGYSTRLLGRDDDDIANLLDDQVAAVLLSNVDYRSGRLLDMERITRQAHEAGALVIWDLCHSAGVIPLELDAIGADFAVGCSYKYLNGGPGAPAYIYVAERHHDSARQPLSGWWGHAAPFAFESSFRPTAGIRRFLVGTQSILGLKGVEAAMDLFEGVDMQAIRRKSRNLCDSFIQLVEQHPDCRALRLASPREAEERGSQVAFDFAGGYAVVRAMIEQGVIGDFREPGIMRFGLAPYYLRFTDLFDAVEVMADCLRREVWMDPKYATRETVT